MKFNIELTKARSQSLEKNGLTGSETIDEMKSPVKQPFTEAARKNQPPRHTQQSVEAYS